MRGQLMGQADAAVAALDPAVAAEILVAEGQRAGGPQRPFALNTPIGLVAVDVVIGRNKARLLVVIPETDGTLRRAAGNLGQIGAAFQPQGGGGQTAPPGGQLIVLLLEIQAASDRYRRSETRSLALRHIQRQPCLCRALPAQIDAHQLVVGHAGGFRLRREAQPQAVIHPCLHPAADGHPVDIAGGRDIFVLDHQIDLIVAQGVVDDQPATLRRSRQRAVQLDQPLEIVDGIVAARRQPLAADHPARGAVAPADRHHLGAAQDVLPLEEIERATGTAQHVALHQPVRLRCIAGDHMPGLARCGLLGRAPQRLRAVKRAVAAHQLMRVVLPVVEIAQHDMAAVLLDMEIDPARGRRIGIAGRIVAEGQIDIVRRDAVQNPPGAFFVQTVDQVVQIILARVDRGGDDIARTRHPLGIAGQTPNRIAVAAEFLTVSQLGMADPEPAGAVKT